MKSGSKSGTMSLFPAGGLEAAFLCCSFSCIWSASHSGSVQDGLCLQCCHSIKHGNRTSVCTQLAKESQCKIGSRANGNRFNESYVPLELALFRLIPSAALVRGSNSISPVATRCMVMPWGWTVGAIPVTSQWLRSAWVRGRTPEESHAPTVGRGGGLRSYVQWKVAHCNNPWDDRTVFICCLQILSQP
jgi:hypothetical protein